MGIALSHAEPCHPAQGGAGEKGWYVAYTQPQREQLAQLNLVCQGFEAYFCQYKTFKKTPEGLVETWQPMFPRYIFFRPLHEGQSISVVHSTRGIAFVLRFGLVPALLKPEELRLIKALESAQNQMDAKEKSPFQPGIKVRLQNCGLSGLEGLVHSVSSKRVTLLIELLGREQKLQLEHHQVELLGQ